MTIIFATGNGCKLREASEILGEGFELVTPAAKGIVEEIPETGTTMPVERIASLMTQAWRWTSSEALQAYILLDMPVQRKVSPQIWTSSCARCLCTNMRRL